MSSLFTEKLGAPRVRGLYARLEGEDEPRSPDVSRPRITRGAWFAHLPEARDARAVCIAGGVGPAVFGILAFTMRLWGLGFEPRTPLLPWLHPRDPNVIPLVAKALGRPHPLEVTALGALAAEVPATATLRFFLEPHYGLLFYLGRNAPVVHDTFEALSRPGWALLSATDWNRFEGARVLPTAWVVSRSPRVALRREGSRRLLLQVSAS